MDPGREVHEAPSRQGVRTKNFVGDCEFEQVATRKNQALLLQAEKSGQKSMSLAAKTSQDSGTSGSGDSGQGAGGE
ncbi:MAG: hypothetical protein IJ557_10715 [Bacteroidaceae bacterium]|nr:hypothetical protein [Bacteroidaceae bacterium]